MNYEQFIQEKCFEENPTVLDDNMPDFFDNWVSGLEYEDWIKYGNEFSISKNAAKIGSIKSEKKSISSKENGKKGGRPRLTKENK